MACVQYHRYSDPYLCLGVIPGLMWTSVNADGTKTWFDYDMTPSSTKYAAHISAHQIAELIAFCSLVLSSSLA